MVPLGTPNQFEVPRTKPVSGYETKTGKITVPYLPWESAYSFIGRNIRQKSLSNWASRT